MHDANGEPLAVGDVVSLDCVIEQVNPQEDYCNITLKTILPPLPETIGPSTLVLNSRQVIKNRKATVPEPVPVKVINVAEFSSTSAKPDAEVRSDASSDKPQVQAASINR